MTSKRLFYVLCITLLLLSCISIGGAVIGNMYIKQEAQTIVALKAEGLALDEQSRSLVQAKKDIKKYEELERISKSIVPQEKDQARTVREIIVLAEQSGVPISSITFPDSNLGQASAKSTTSSAGNAASATTASSATTQVKPVDGIPSVFQLEISIQSESAQPVPYKSMLNFLSKLEQNRRTAHITSLSVTPYDNDRNRVTFNLNVNAYIKP